MKCQFQYLPGMGPLGSISVPSGIVTAPSCQNTQVPFGSVTYQILPSCLEYLRNQPGQSRHSGRDTPISDSVAIRACCRSQCEEKALPVIPWSLHPDDLRGCEIVSVTLSTSLSFGVWNPLGRLVDQPLNV